MENPPAAPGGDADNVPGEGEHASLFPPPPPHYKLFGPKKAPLPPPPPIVGEYECLGEIHTTEEGLPPLQAPPLFGAEPDGSLDYRAALLKLVDELVFCYAELLDCVARRPSASARAVEAVGAAARNAAYLLSALRPRQARLGVAEAARRDAAEWNARAERLERAAREHDERALLRGVARVEEASCAAAVVDGGGGGGGK